MLQQGDEPDPIVSYSDRHYIRHQLGVPEKGERRSSDNGGGALQAGDQPHSPVSRCPLLVFVFPENRGATKEENHGGAAKKSAAAG